MITLNNNDTVPQQLAIETFATLQRLKENDHMTLWELAMKCHNSSHVIIHEDSKQTLQKLRLINKDGIIPDDIQKIVLNSIPNIRQLRERAFSMQLENPFPGPVPIAKRTCLLL